MTTYYLDTQDGNNSGDGLSFANRKLTLGAFSLSAGDTVRVIASPDPTSLGVNGTWTNQSENVTLASAVNANVSLCQSAWTPSANVTANTSSTRRQGTLSASLAIASGFTTGLVAYEAMGSTDYSNYDQICFWVQVDSPVTANTLQLALCSDNAGATPVDTFTIDFNMSASVWYPIVIDKGSALGSAIQSVALIALLDPGTVTVLLDNIFVATAPADADSLTLNSLIGKNTAGETWWAIKSINGTSVELDLNPASFSTHRGYWGVGETVTAYKRETLKPAITTGNSQSLSISGSSGNVITISGGWNRTDMSTQTGESWLDGRTGQGTGWAFSGNFITVEDIGSVRYQTGTNVTGNDFTGIFAGLNNCNFRAADISGTRGTYTINSVHSNTDSFYIQSSPYIKLLDYLNGHSNGSNGLTYQTATMLISTGDIVCYNNGGNGVNLTGNAYYIDSISAGSNASHGVSTSHLGKSVIKSLTATSNGSRAVNMSAATAPLYIHNLTTSGNTTTPPVAISGGPNQQELYVYKSSIGEASTFAVTPTGLNNWIHSQNEDGTFNNNINYTDGGRWELDTSDPHTGGGVAWKASVTSTSRTSFYPIRVSLCKLAVNSGDPVTFNVWAKKSHASNISARIILPAYSISGVTVDVEQDISATSYTEYTLNFTPTLQGAAEIFLEVWSNNGSTSETVRVADISASQV